MLIAVVEDDLILLGDERRKIDAQVCRREAWIAGVGGIVDETGRLDQVLGGQAAPVDAGAPQSTPLGHHRCFAQVFGMNGGCEGRRATAQNNKIIPLLR